MKKIFKVGELPKAVKIGVILADGIDKYEVKNRHVKIGTVWFLLENVSSPELEARDWFRLEDMYELFFDKTPGPARRKYGTVKRAG